MSAIERVIVVVDDVVERSDRLKSQIEFMDAPRVETARPSQWRADVTDDDRLAAVFVARDMPEDRFNRLLDEIGSHDPNVPIVLVDGDTDA